MDSPFIFDKPVTGKSHIGRKEEAAALRSILEKGGSAVMYEPPKTGKTSLIRQTLLGMKMTGSQFASAEISLLGVRTRQSLFKRMITGLTLAGYPSAQDRPDFGELLENCNDFAALFALPRRISTDTGRKMIVVLQEFQNVIFIPECEKILAAFQTSLSAGGEGDASFIVTGSQINAMKGLFEGRRFGGGRITRVELGRIDLKDISDSIIRGFLTGGKVIEKGQVYGICNALRSNIWYVNHVASICDSMARGYVVEPMVVEAMQSLVSIHEPRFIATMNDLTTYQVSLLHAICDGVTRFSSSDIIRRYGLTSSANVVRLKDALCRKEIITFDGKDRPVILDPLFEYWLDKYYFI